MLGYYPSETWDDGGWRKVRVRVLEGVKLRYRDGYIDYWFVLSWETPPGEGPLMISLPSGRTNRAPSCGSGMWSRARSTMLDMVRSASLRARIHCTAESVPPGSLQLTHSTRVQLSDRGTSSHVPQLSRIGWTLESGGRGRLISRAKSAR